MIWEFYNMVNVSEVRVLLRSARQFMPKNSKAVVSAAFASLAKPMDGEIPSERVVILRQIERERKSRKSLTA